MTKQEILFYEVLKGLKDEKGLVIGELNIDKKDKNGISYTMSIRIPKLKSIKSYVKNNLLRKKFEELIEGDYKRIIFKGVYYYDNELIRKLWFS